MPQILDQYWLTLVFPQNRFCWDYFLMPVPSFRSFFLEMKKIKRTSLCQKFEEGHYPAAVVPKLQLLDLKSGCC